MIYLVIALKVFAILAASLVVLLGIGLACEEAWETFAWSPITKKRTNR